MVLKLLEHSSGPPNEIERTAWAKRFMSRRSNQSNQQPQRCCPTVVRSILTCILNLGRVPSRTPTDHAIAWPVVNMSRRVRLGVLVPSSNTVVEPLTHLIISSINIPNTTITVHFSRFQVTEISQSESALSQFDLTPILAAAQLLADAQVNVIGWSGTSAGWLGFDRDIKMCKAIHEATGIPATSSTLALNVLLEAFAVKKLCLVTPYLFSMNEAIIRNYISIGVAIDCERHLDIINNAAIGEVSEQQLNEMVDSVVAEGGTAITTFCTNLQAAHLVPIWERKHSNVIIFDTVATVIWQMLNMVSVDPRIVTGWGRMFSIDPHRSNSPMT